MSVQDSLGESVGRLWEATSVTGQDHERNGNKKRNGLTSSRVNCQTMIVLSREAVRIISGFSDEVATAVTHPLCPTREPERVKKDISLWPSYRFHPAIPFGRSHLLHDLYHCYCSTNDPTTLQTTSNIDLKKTPIFSPLRVSDQTNPCK